MMSITSDSRTPSPQSGATGVGQTASNPASIVDGDQTQPGMNEPAESDGVWKPYARGAMAGGLVALACALVWGWLADLIDYPIIHILAGVVVGVAVTKGVQWKLGHSGASVRILCMVLGAIGVLLGLARSSTGFGMQFTEFGGPVFVVGAPVAGMCLGSWFSFDD